LLLLFVREDFDVTEGVTGATFGGSTGGFVAVQDMPLRSEPPVTLTPPMSRGTTGPTLKGWIILRGSVDWRGSTVMLGWEGSAKDATVAS
jgi:hypothetical protein